LITLRCPHICNILFGDLRKTQVAPMIRVRIPQRNFDENFLLEPVSRRDQDLERGYKSLTLLSVHKFYRSKN
jgi:hypothetical protein